MSMIKVQVEFMDDMSGMAAQDCYSGLINFDEPPFTECEYEEANDILYITGSEESVRSVVNKIKDGYGEIVCNLVDEYEVQAESVKVTGKEAYKNFQMLREARQQLFTNKLRPAHRVPKTFGIDFAVKARAIKSILTDSFVSAAMEIANYKIERQDIKARVMQVVEEADLRQYDEAELIDYVTDEVIAWAEEQGRD